VRNVIIVVIFCAVIIGVPTGAWALGHIVRGLSCCPWRDFLDATIQMAPLGISLGVIAALVVGAYERLLRAVEQREH
jgi:hypothetical protein